MLLSTQHNSSIKLLSKFYEPKSYLLVSMTQQLEEIVKLVKRCKNGEVDKMVKVILKYLINGSKRKHDLSNPYWLVVFKSMLLIHQLLTVGVVGNMFQQVLETISDSLSFLSHTITQHLSFLHKKLSTKPTSTSLHQQFQHQTFQNQIIHKKLLTPYYHYLTRRCQMLPKAFDTASKCYYLINLLNTASQCNEVIHMFGRYNKLDEFLVMGEFNLVLAKDVTLLYALLKQCLRDDCIDGQMNPQHQKQRLSVSQVDDILLSTHQQLYPIFYNKYHYKKVHGYIPNWIDLDIYIHKSTKSNFKKYLHSLEEKDNLALDQTASSIIGEKSITPMKKSTNCHNPNISSEVLQKSLAVINELEKFLENFEEFV